MIPMGRSRHVAGTTLAVVIALGAACSRDYVHVVIEGPELSSSVVDLNASIYGGGKATSFNYTANFRPGDGGVPQSDFVVEVDDSSVKPVTVRVSSSENGGDLLLPEVQGALEKRLVLSPIEQVRSQKAQFGDGTGENLALFSNGIVLGWPAQEGGLLRVIDRDPINVQQRPTTIGDAGTTVVEHVRTASRPVATGFGPDVSALSWIDSNGQLHSAAFTLLTEGQPKVKDLGPASDGFITLAFKGATFDLAVASVASTGSIALRFFSVDPTGTATESLAEYQLPLQAAGMVGMVATPANKIVVALKSVHRSDGFSDELALVDPTGSIITEVPIEGSLRAVALNADGTRLLVATTRADRLLLTRYYAGNLGQVQSEPADVGTSRISAGPQARLALSSCLIAWPELRADGSAQVDLRYQYFDADAKLLGSSHLANVGTSGDHFAPSVACASTTRAYISFYGHEKDSTTATFYLRRVPAPEKE